PDGSDNWIFMEEPTPGASNISMSAENDVLNDQGIAMKNYPNPFSEKTAIMFSISPELESEARINLYNIKGQFIRTYSGDQIVKSVNNQIFWDGRDSDNKLVADGLYLYKLTTSEGSISRKMILLH
ncbi:MAG: T9SS type A sorting domain-containing protein, partial [Candidatus Cloacimonetes bacterium]|nr:T9SS type A sorting domain-containing protein [Candidatus Cloacimonadota bacterium]